MKQRFFLARHGQTQWNVIKKLQGRLDSPVTAQGLEQAKQLADKLVNHNINQIISSPIGRAKTTAQVCQQRLDIPLSYNDGLIERDFGDWQGELFEQLTEQPHFESIFYQVTEHAPPNGESGIACANRFKQTLITIARQLERESVPQSVLIITHGDLLRCLCEQLGQQSFVDAYSQYGNGALFVVDFDSQTQVFTATPFG